MTCNKPYQVDLEEHILSILCVDCVEMIKEVNPIGGLFDFPRESYNFCDKCNKEIDNILKGVEE